jgi:biotin carboxyl carrier protein
MPTFDAVLGGARHQLVLATERDRPGAFKLTVDGAEVSLDARPLGERAYSILLDGSSYLVEVSGQLPDLTVHVVGQSIPVQLVDARRSSLARAAARVADAEGPTILRSPMPGKLVKLLCKTGDAVRAGAPLAVVEAMKMENELRAPRDGTVGKLMVTEGQALETGQPLAEIV